MIIKPTYAGLFEGMGGFALGADRAGYEVALSCEIDKFCSSILNYYWPNATHYDDITKTDFAPHRGTIDVLCGGFPCQGFSLAGNRKGTDDNRYLWPEMLRAVNELQPACIIGENVTGILSMEDKSGDAVDVFSKVEGRTLTRLREVDRYEAIYTRQAKMLVSTICEDLEAAGYEVQPLSIPAASVGAPHRRDRIWFIAHARCERVGVEKCRAHRQKRQLSSTPKSEVLRQKNRPVDAKGFTKPSPYRDAAHAHKCPAGSPGKGGKAHKIRSENHLQPQERREPPKQHTGCGDVSPDAANATSGRGFQDNGEGKPEQFDQNLERSNWENFPTQSPVCDGNDGLSARLDRITVHTGKRARTLKPDQAAGRWKRETIKAGGNAVVPDIPQIILTEMKNQLL